MRQGTIMKKAFFFLVLAGLLFGTVAAMQQGGQQDQPELWEYKTVAFKIEVGEPVEKITRRFDNILNRGAAAGWQYAGPCCHIGTDHFGIDYVVLRRKIIQR